MKTRAIFLMKNREIRFKKINPRKDKIKLGSGLYIVGVDSINNYEVKGEIKGSEIIFFEGNPNPLNVKEPTKDNSQKFLDDLLLENALRQTGHLPSIQWGQIVEKLQAFTDPNLIIWILFLGAILYGVIVGGL